METSTSWLTPRRLFLILPPYLVGMLLIGFAWLPSTSRTASWVCASCARVWTETREEKLGITVAGLGRLSSTVLSEELDPQEACRHAWRRYGGAGAARLDPLRTWPVETWLRHLRPLGTSLKDLVRWDLRGEAPGAWTRGPFPTLRTEAEFRAWFRAVQAADPAR